MYLAKDELYMSLKVNFIRKMLNIKKKEDKIKTIHNNRERERNIISFYIRNMGDKYKDCQNFKNKVES